MPPKPEEAACPDGTTRLTLLEGETLGTVASSLRVTQGRLLRLNETLAPSEFTAGRQICVPTSALARSEEG